VGDVNAKIPKQEDKKSSNQLQANGACMEHQKKIGL
jgi:hypothetical protein